MALPRSRRPRRPRRRNAEIVVEQEPCPDSALDLALAVYSRAANEAAAGWYRDHGLIADAVEAPEAQRYVDQIAREVERNVVANRNRIPGIPSATAAGGKEILEAYRRRNVLLVKTVGANVKRELAKTLRESPGLHVEALTQRLQRVAGVERSRARLWARDQTLKLHADLTEAEHRALGIVEYEWRTVGDGNVRSGHAALNRRRFRYDDPPETGTGTHSPGQDYQCRCHGNPVIPSLAAGQRPAPQPRSKPRPAPTPQAKPAPAPAPAPAPRSRPKPARPKRPRPRAPEAPDRQGNPWERPLPQATDISPDSVSQRLRDLLARELLESGALVPDGSVDLTAARAAVGTAVRALYGVQDWAAVRGLKNTSVTTGSGGPRGSWDPADGAIWIRNDSAPLLESALRSIAAGKDAYADRAALRTFVHEVLHGHSPEVARSIEFEHRQITNGRRTYRMPIVIEEAATEQLARYFVLGSHTSSEGSYNALIDGLARIARQARPDLSGLESKARLTDAARRIRRPGAPLLRDEATVIREWSDAYFHDDPAAAARYRELLTRTETIDYDY